jgi:putative nucleotidyltransferase with HDIG domain
MFEQTADVEVPEVLSEKTKKMALQTIKEQFSRIYKKETSERQNVNIQSFQNVIKSILEDLQSFSGTLTVMTDLCSHDEYTFKHSLNVTVYSLILAMADHYSERQLLEIGLGAILHDVGKLSVPKEIIQKPGKLTDEEFDVIKAHTTNGFNILRKIHEVSLPAAHCAYQHHERFNGCGYPRGLKGEEIHQYARIMAVADVFDALTSERSYRPLCFHIKHYEL